MHWKPRWSPQWVGVRLLLLLETWLGVYQTSGITSPAPFLGRAVARLASLFSSLPIDFVFNIIGGHRQELEARLQQRERPAAGGGLTAGEEVSVGGEG